jgi:hypothetical protein
MCRDGGSLNRFGLRQRQRDNVTAIPATGEVLEHNGTFEFGQSPL